MRTREWMKSTDPGAMLWDVSASAMPYHDCPPQFEYAVRAALRRLRLFLLHTFRTLVEQFDSPACHSAVALGWQFAEGTASANTIPTTDAALSAEHRAIWEESRHEGDMSADRIARLGLINALTLMLRDPAGAARNFFPRPHAGLAHVPTFRPPIQPTRACALLREIFGERGRLLAEPEWRAEWRTDTVLVLARQMYDSEQFGAMPILADALQDAGCDNAKILAHCRDPKATHVRGCWVLDTVLGKV